MDLRNSYISYNGFTKFVHLNVNVKIRKVRQNYEFSVKHYLAVYSSSRLEVDWCSNFHKSIGMRPASNCI